MPSSPCPLVLPLLCKINVQLPLQHLLLHEFADDGFQCPLLVDSLCAWLGGILAYVLNAEEVEVAQLEDAEEDKGQPVVQEALAQNVHLGTGVQQEL